MTASSTGRYRINKNAVKLDAKGCRPVKRCDDRFAYSDAGDKPETPSLHIVVLVRSIHLGT